MVRVLVFKEFDHVNVADAVDRVSANQAPFCELLEQGLDVDRVGREGVLFYFFGPVLEVAFPVCQRP